MEQCVKDINDDKNEIYDEEKKAEFPDDTFPVDMEEGVNDIKDNKNRKND